MKSLVTALEILEPKERKSALLILPLIVISGLLDMFGVALVFPFLKLLTEPELLSNNAYLAWAYDAGAFSSASDFIVFTGIIFVCFLLLSSLFKIFTVYVANRWLEGRAQSLSVRMLQTYLKQPYEKILSRNSSDLVANMISETNRIVSNIYRSFSEFVMSIVVLVLLMGLLLVIDATITLLAIAAFTLLYGLMLIVVKNKTSMLGETILQSNRNRHRLAWEALAGGKQVRLLNRESSLVNSFSEPAQAYAMASALGNTLRQAPRHIVESVAIGGTVFLTLALMLRSGGLGTEAMANAVPVLGVFALAVHRMMPAFQRGYNAVMSLRLSSASAESIRSEFESATNLMPLPEGKITPIPFHDSIELKDLTFTYPGADEPSLSNINLKIAAGSSIGIIGQTGAGKTTLMDLLLGLLPPTSGQILVDGRQLDATQVRSWRANIGYVPQDMFLSDASVAQNIAFGVPENEIDMARVDNASQMAQIKRFILEEMPEGYDSIVGEDGVRLSGGQRQRISIARALYSLPEVIVFDEATSALDTGTEDLLMQEIGQLARQNTLIMVAHRLSTVKDCDLIISLSAGKIEWAGTYDDLMARQVLPLTVVSSGQDHG